MAIFIIITSSIHPNRITLHIPPQSRVIIPEVVLIKPRLRIEVLAGETQCVVDGVERYLCFTKSLSLGPSGQ